MRHWTYTTKSQPGYQAIMDSLDLHDDLVSAFVIGDWALVGQLMHKYMRLREIIDPSALKSVHDTDDLCVLPFAFEFLHAKGLTEGGMLSGAMGGGVMMVIAKEDGVKSIIKKAVEELKQVSRAYEQMTVLSYKLVKQGVVSTVEIK
jgi:hypothetical protein